MTMKEKLARLKTDLARMKAEHRLLEVQADLVHEEWNKLVHRRNQVFGSIQAIEKRIQRLKEENGVTEDEIDESVTEIYTA